MFLLKKRPFACRARGAVLAAAWAGGHEATLPSLAGVVGMEGAVEPFWVSFTGFYPGSGTQGSAWVSGIEFFKREKGKN